MVNRNFGGNSQILGILIDSELFKAFNFAFGINGCCVNDAESLRHCIKAASFGSGEAACWLGMRYYYGETVPKDLTKAAKYLELASAKGEDEAMFHLAILYETGEGVKKDLKRAFDLNDKAAKLGNAGAMVNLAYCYENGLGTAENILEAYHWYYEAALEGDKDGKKEADRLELQLTRKEISDAHLRVKI